MMGDASGMLPGPIFPQVTSSLTLQVVGDLLPIFITFYPVSLPRGYMTDSILCRLSGQAVGPR
jgi:hypothetical protein